MKRREFIKSGAAVAAVSMTGLRANAASGQQIRWVRMSSVRGELPVPSTSREQTGDVIGR